MSLDNCGGREPPTGSVSYPLPLLNTTAPECHNMTTSSPQEETEAEKVKLSAHTSHSVSAGWALVGFATAAGSPSQSTRHRKPPLKNTGVP